MNFIQIVLTTKCQLTCWHCPMKDYRNTDDEPWVLTNERLIPFLEKNISPKDWVVELTGGEPALYKGIEELEKRLNEGNSRFDRMDAELKEINKSLGIIIGKVDTMLRRSGHTSEDA